MGKRKQAASPLMRVVADLYDRIDFQKGTIDGLRGERVSLFDAIDELNTSLNAAIEVSEMSARSGAHWAESYRQAETALARVQAVVNRAHYAVTQGRETRDEVAAMLAEVAQTAAAPAPEPMPSDELRRQIASSPETIYALDEVAEAVRGYLAGMKDRGPFLGDDVPDLAEPALPPGFITIDPDTLPASLAEKIAAQHATGATFVEVDAADLPRDVFRRLFGLDRQDAPEPVKAPDCFGEGCTQECNTKGCARERAEAEQAPHSVTDFTEAEHFMIEAAEQHGFEPVGDELERYTAEPAQIIALVKAARAQGQRDVLALAEETAGVSTSLPLAEGFKFAVDEIRERARQDAAELAA